MAILTFEEELHRQVLVDCLFLLTQSASPQRNKTLAISVLDMTLNILMVRLQ